MTELSLLIVASCFNSIVSILTLVVILRTKNSERVAEDSSDEKSVEENLQTRLYDLQTAQFGLRPMNYVRRELPNRKIKQ